ncbi:hypothetical protein A2X44_00285 [candidate division CPR3 bacterium GWF2_35_18]|uniref:DUF1232 domain-containing protein n=1 Tax=candidate division CPR3 bacterium GW2011_GWF2_35_18 TaxID=1618350 RepID=A0A0G0ES06_UNCC3|nr:MAG: hypothetical protein UR67_C0001G0041 [candidate division CPR3 bacterium GW2011_GWF2_35_18]OGB63351.1 MAG: hypothetical protein A2X44_00285 [candidate division CPR3 bacterium GWF2_35_18]OGB65581.1 MAG: hypothetical protein A2250_02230 [candidate division CPR3 bacterium RIFOXYA2_FULL_35_13]
MKKTPPANPQPSPSGRARLRRLPEQNRKDLIADIVANAKEVWMLFRHPKVLFRHKLIFIGTILYVIVPVDIFFGPFDDVIVLYFGSQWFLDLARADIGVQQSDSEPLGYEEEVVEAEVQEIK